MHADLVIIGAKALTMDGKLPEVDMVACHKGRIIQVGQAEDADRLIGPSTTIIEADGKLLLPGFIDAHTHFIQMGISMTDVSLSATGSMEEALELLARKVTATPEGEWVWGVDWDETDWIREVIPTRHELDNISTSHMVMARRVCGHLCCINSLALEKFGFEPGMPGVELSENSEPNGILREEAVEEVYRATRPGLERNIEGLALATERALGLGVTSVHDFPNPTGIQAYMQALKNGSLGVRVCIYRDVSELDVVERSRLEVLEKSNMVGMDRMNEHIDSSLGIQLKDAGPELYREEELWLRMVGFKLSLDGAIGAKTAALSEGYRGDEANNGLLMLEDDELVDLLERVHGLGLAAAVHAIGDRAIDQVIKAFGKMLTRFEQVNKQTRFEQVNKQAMIDHSNADHRLDNRPKHRIEHLELAGQDHLASMKELGLTASMQPNFTGQWGGSDGMYQARLPEDWVERINPLRWALDAGVPMAFGSDCMPFSPLYGIECAVDPPHDVQCISFEEAVRGYTLGAAEVAGEGVLKGSLEPGKLADMVLLSHDPRDPAGTGFRDLEVMATFVGGKQVYSKL